jgi:hypothetical protein
MRLYHGLLAALFIDQLTLATPADICDDLFRLSCAPGIYDDGTGVAQNPTAINDPNQEPKKKLAENAKDRFKRVLQLQDDNSIYFRKAVLSATGLALNPACAGAETSPSSDCLDLLSEGAADIAVKKLTRGGFYMSNFGNKISDDSFVANSDVFNIVKSQLLEDFKKSIGNEELAKKIKDNVFPKVKALLVSKVEAMISDPELRKNLVDKIRAIQFAGTTCSEGRAGEETIDGLLVPNANYSSVRNSFQFCAGYATVSQSEFQMARTIAHELSHSIDPCYIAVGPASYRFNYSSGLSRSDAEREFPFKGVLSCLRSKESVSAEIGEPDERRPMGMNMQDGGISRPRSSNTSNQPFKSFCRQDVKGEQINESFADWLAGEVLPDYIEKFHPNLTRQQIRIGYSNAFRGSCSKPYADDDDDYKDPHPSDEKRINNILLVQPKIREQMGCPSSLPVNRKYCPHGAQDDEVSNSMTREIPGVNR